MKKTIISVWAIICLMMIAASSCFALIHFDITRIEGTELFYDLEHDRISNQPNYVWPESIPIPLIPEMPAANIIDVGEFPADALNGYITELDGQFYWAGRRGGKNSPRPLVPLGTSIPETLENLPYEWEPDLFPYNSRNLEFSYEQTTFNERGHLRNYPGRIGKWVFGWNADTKRTHIFVDGVYNIETDISFRVEDNQWRGTYDNVMFWEDATYFYIRNYNLLLKTEKQPLYDALNVLENVPKVKVNDTILGFAQPPTMESDRTLVPMRFLFEQLGAEVDWEESTQTAIAKKDDTEIQFSIDNISAEVDGKTETMDVPARLIGDKTMVPLRFLSESLDYEVEWDEETNMATITAKQPANGFLTFFSDVATSVQNFFGSF